MQQCFTLRDNDTDTPISCEDRSQGSIGGVFKLAPILPCFSSARGFRIFSCCLKNDTA